MSSPRPATHPIAIIALTLLGGAFATVVVIVGTVLRNLRTTALFEFRMSTTYFVLECLLAGLAVGVLLLFTRPRGPLAPVLAAISAFVAMEVGLRIGIYVSLTMQLERFLGTSPLGNLLTPHFGQTQAYELIAALVAGGLALAKVLISAGSTAPRSSQPFGSGPPVPGAPFGAPGAPGVPGPPAMGQPMPGQPPVGPPAPGPMAAPGQPAPGQPAPGQPAPGQPPAGGPGWSPGQPIDPPSSPH